MSTTLYRSRFQDHTIVFAKLPRGSVYVGEYDKIRSKGAPDYFNLYFRGEFKGRVLDTATALENLKYYVDLDGLQD